jgi:hypothetical protein
MSDSAIERLKNRERKKVLTRNASLNQTSQSFNESNNNDLLTKTSQSVNESNNNDLLTETSQSVNESNNNDLLTETSQSILSIDTEPIRRTIRLDPTVDAYMDTLCKKNKITKETLFEAAIIVCSNNQKILNKAIADAQKRYSNRKRIGEMKKLETMNRKFQDYSG